MGGGVVKVLILQFFEIWKWLAHEATKHDCPEYYNFAEMMSSSKNAFFV
jgi:hypothetical protein